MPRFTKRYYIIQGQADSNEIRAIYVHGLRPLEYLAGPFANMGTVNRRGRLMAEGTGKTYVPLNWDMDAEP